MTITNRNLVNTAVSKWEPIIRSLNFDNILIEPVSIFSELFSINNSYNQTQNNYDSMILPIALKTLSKLNLDGVKLFIDTENCYKFDNYNIKINLTIDQEQELILKIGEQSIHMLEHSIIEQIANNINDEIKVRKADTLIINSNFICQIKRFEKCLILPYSFKLINIKKERLDKIIKINNCVK